MNHPIANPIISSTVIIGILLQSPP